MFIIFGTERELLQKYNSLIELGEKDKAKAYLRAYHLELERNSKECAKTLKTLIR